MQSYYDQALERCRQESIQDETYYSSIAVTTTYNIARLHEATCQFDKAEQMYKDILRDHTNYIDCKCYHWDYTVLLTNVSSSLERCPDFRACMCIYTVGSL